MGKLLEAVFGFTLMLLVLSMILHHSSYEPSVIKDKRILITNVASAVGKETAYEYAKLQTKLVLVASDPTELQKAAKKCKDLGASLVQTLVGDLANASFRETLMQKTDELFGGLDHLILNHISSFESPLGPWAGTFQNLSALQDEMNLRFMIYVDIASKFLPQLLQSKGRIGVITSLVGKVPLPKMTARAPSEAALLGFFPALRQELYYKRTGVKVTSIALGYLATEKGTNAVGNNYPFFNRFIVTPLNHAAKLIVDSVIVGKTELSYPFMSQVHFTLHNFVPRLYEGRLFS